MCPTFATDVQRRSVAGAACGTKGTPGAKALRRSHSKAKNQTPSSSPGASVRSACCAILPTVAPRGSVGHGPTRPSSIDSRCRVWRCGRTTGIRVARTCPSNGEGTGVVVHIATPLECSTMPARHGSGTPRIPKSRCRSAVSTDLGRRGSLTPVRRSLRRSPRDTHARHGSASLQLWRCRPDAQGIRVPADHSGAEDVGGSVPRSPCLQCPFSRARRRPVPTIRRRRA